MTTLKSQARFAGFLYLLIVFLAPVAVFYVPSQTIVRGDATATATKLLAHEALFRFGMAGHILSTLIFFFVVLALYRLLKDVNPNVARVMLALVVAAVPIALYNEITYVAALILFKGADFLSAFDESQRNSLGYLFIRLHAQGANIASIFWGLWLFPFGALVIRSGFIPKLLGYLLMVAGTGYVVSSLTTIALPQFADLVSTYAMPLYFGELPVIFWLVIWGAKGPRADAPIPAGG